jgi:hypothetical protein
MRRGVVFVITGWSLLQAGLTDSAARPAAWNRR